MSIKLFLKHTKNVFIKGKIYIHTRNKNHKKLICIEITQFYLGNLFLLCNCLCYRLKKIYEFLNCCYLKPFEKQLSLNGHLSMCRDYLRWLNLDVKIYLPYPWFLDSKVDRKCYEVIDIKEPLKYK